LEHRWPEFFRFAKGDELVASPDFVSAIGTLFPIAPFGRSSLYYLRQHALRRCHLLRGVGSFPRGRGTLGGFVTGLRLCRVICLIVTTKQ